MSIDVIIIGAGPAGLSAAVYARRAGLEVCVLESNIYGGQIINTPEVENYPAISRLTGPEFAMALYNQASEHGAKILLEGATKVELLGETKRVHTAGGVYEAPTVIIANGVVRRKLGCPGEEEFSGKGVSYCATCDGAFFRDKEVAIVGGGDTALEDALFLAANCKKVTLIHRRDEFRGSKILVNSVLAGENIEIAYDTVVEKIVGDGRVSGAVLRNKLTDKTTEIALEAVFVAVGLIPQNDILVGQITLDAQGYVVAGEDTLTNISGVFAAGDTRTKGLRQLVTAASDGSIAATAAAQYLLQRSV